MGMSQQVNIKRLRQQIINQAAQTSERVFSEGFPPAYQEKAATEQEALTGETNLKHITPKTLNAVLLEKLIPDDPELAPLVEFLRDRQNHEGTQGVDTIEGLAEAVNGWIQQATIAAEKVSGQLSADNIPGLPASKITSGTLPVASGGTGRTDGKAIPLGLAFGEVGATALLKYVGGGTEMDTPTGRYFSGTGLRMSSAGGTTAHLSGPSGTWVLQGNFGAGGDTSGAGGVSVFQRVS